MSTFPPKPLLEQDLSSRSKPKHHRPKFQFSHQPKFQFSHRPLSIIQDIRPLRVELHRLRLPQQLIDEVRRRQPRPVATQTPNRQPQPASTQTTGLSDPPRRSVSTQTTDPSGQPRRTTSTQTTPTPTPSPEPSPNSSLSEDELEGIRRFIVETSPSRQATSTPEPEIRLPPHIQETFDEIDRLHLKWEEAQRQSHERFIRVQEHLTGINEILQRRSRR
jgi:hypothetical protein